MFHSNSNQELKMKIQIVKKGNVKVKPLALCPYMVEIPPEANKK